MKRFLIVVCLLCSPVVFAQNYSLEFKQVGINELVFAVVKGILRQDYVIAPEAAAIDSKVSLSVHNLDYAGVLSTFDNVLNGVGLQVTDKAGVLYVEKKSHSAPVEAVAPVPVQSAPVAVVKSDVPSDEEPVVYFPKFRSSDYLSLAVRAAGARLVDMQSGQQVTPFSSFPSAMPSMGFVQPMAQVRPGASGQVAQPGRDVLVYSGRPSALSKVEKLLKQLDRPAVGLHLRGAVLEVSDSSENVRSISGLLSMLGGKLNLVLEAGKAVGNAIVIKGSNLTAVLSAVDGDSRFKFLSEPQMRVVEGETAKLVVGQDVPVRGQIQTDKDGNNLQSIEYSW